MFKIYLAIYDEKDEGPNHGILITHVTSNHTAWEVISRAAWLLRKFGLINLSGHGDKWTG